MDLGVIEIIGYHHFRGLSLGLEAIQLAVWDEYDTCRYEGLQPTLSIRKGSLELE